VLSRFGLPMMVPLCALFAGCLHQAISKPEDLSSSHDQVKSFVVQRPFDEVHALVSRTAAKCYTKVSSGTAMPAGKSYVTTGTGIHRDIDDRLLDPGKSAIVAVVVRGGPPPFGPEDYFLRADIKSVGPNETEVTTYNAKPVKAQRAFHQQVHHWAVDEIEDCSGTGPFDR